MLGISLITSQGSRSRSKVKVGIVLLEQSDPTTNRPKVLPLADPGGQSAAMPPSRLRRPGP